MEVFAMVVSYTDGIACRRRVVTAGGAFRAERSELPRVEEGNPQRSALMATKRS
jgi:hypothetical protein